ncbi:glutamate racemase [Dolosigranulum savutiense]|uniref:Glutamate racemase n=1 Tax=Dolosigranulum savutiense TaxID=3110288 RepID=A0AB74TS43_9LACT
MKKRPIGFIDSGVGGLTVVKEAMRQLPHEVFCYIGDTARCPYGPRTPEQVRQFTIELAYFLMEKDIKLLVIACNTATATTLTTLKELLPIPIVGVILPGSRAAIKATRNQRIAVIGTEGTIASNEYQKSIFRKNQQIDVVSLACPKFVPVVESNEYTGPLAKRVVRETLMPLHKTKMDTLILGCTHYPLLRPIIQDVMGQEIQLIDSGAETINEVSVLLDYYNLAEANPNSDPLHQFYTTGSAEMFKRIASAWLGFDHLVVNHIDLKEIEGKYGTE